MALIFYVKLGTMYSCCLDVFSAPASAPIISTEDPFASSNGNKIDVQSRASQSDYPASVAEPEELSGGNSESISSQHIESYAEIGLIRTGSPPYSSTEDQLQNPGNLPNNFSVSRLVT